MDIWAPIEVISMRHNMNQTFNALNTEWDDARLEDSKVLNKTLNRLERQVKM